MCCKLAAVILRSWTTRTSVRRACLRLSQAMLTFLCRSSEWRLALRSVASTLGDDAVADGLGSDLELVRAENEDLHEEVRSSSSRGSFA
jgi:hypothetical protein